MTHNQTPTSGTSKLPKLLPYPQLLPAASIAALYGKLCYVVKRYEPSGLSVLACVGPGRANMQIGDFNGEKVEPRRIMDVSKQVAHVIEIMNTIQLSQAQFYFAGPGLVLVDVRVHVNGFIGPGMMRDLFGNAMDTQEVVATIPMDEATFGSLEPGLIVKPSKFTLHDDGPLYVESK